MPLQDQILALALDQVDFTNDALEQQFEAMNAANVKLSHAAIAVDRAAETAGVDVSTVAESVVTMATAFGKSYRQLNADQRAQLKAAFQGLFSASDPTVEATVEELFTGTLEFIDAAQALNEWVAANLPDAPPPPPPSDEETRRSSRK